MADHMFRASRYPFLSAAAPMFIATIATLATLVASAPAHAEEEPCDDQAEHQAKERFQRGEAFKTLDQYAQAAAEFEAAFDVCPRAFLVFNAAQMHWLAGEKQRSLDLYRSYLEMEPRGVAASVAREQFYLAALEFQDKGQLADALSMYQLYLELAPRGDSARTARRRVQELLEAEANMAKARADDWRKESATQEDAVTIEVARTPPPARPSPDRPEAVVTSEAGGHTDRSWNAWKPVSVVGGGAVLLIIGGVVHGSAARAGDEYDALYQELCPLGCQENDLPPELVDKRASIRTRKRIAIVSYLTSTLAQ